MNDERLARMEVDIKYIKEALTGTEHSKGLVADVYELKQDKANVAGAIWVLRLLIGGLGLTELLSWWHAQK